MYKFVRINEGEMRGAYHHPNFQRDRLDLIEKINRKERDAVSGAQIVDNNKVIKAKSKNDVPPALDTYRFDIGNSADSSFGKVVEDELESGEFELIDFSSEQSDLSRNRMPSEPSSVGMSTANTKHKLHLYGLTSAATHPKFGDYRIKSKSLLEASSDAVFPIMNTPEDILNEIISTFSHTMEEV